MAEFLSPEWVGELDRVARAAPLADGLADVRLTVEHIVQATPRGDVRYAVTIDRGRVRVSQGAPADPDLTFVTDVETARRLHCGTANAQQALAAGTLRVRGDLARLVDLEDTLTMLEDVFAEVRETTTGV